jgi:hypothetical protein
MKANGQIDLPKATIMFIFEMLLEHIYVIVTGLV